MEIAEDVHSAVKKYNNGEYEAFVAASAISELQSDLADFESDSMIQMTNMMAISRLSVEAVEAMVYSDVDRTTHDVEKDFQILLKNHAS